MRFRTFEVAERSMAPMLLPGDYLIGRRSSAIERFDVVAFLHPRGSHFWLVKRAIALAGETIDLDEGTIDERPYQDPFREELVESGRSVVPPEHVFVMSDNRAMGTMDSRTLGPISLDSCHRIEFRYWPFRGVGRV